MRNSENISDKMSWKQMKEESAWWISDVDFWMDRMSSYQVMLERAIKEKLNPDQLNTIDHLQNIVTYYSKELLINLKSRIFHHQEHVIGQQKSKDVPDETTTKEHGEIAEETESVAEAMKGYAEEFEVLSSMSSASSVSEPKKFRAERILIPTDFSTNAQRATDYALTLLGHEAKEIILLTICHSPFKSNGRPSLIDPEIRENELELLKNETDRIARNHPYLKAKVVVRYEVGLLLDKIEEVANSQKIDLIVMGTKGETGLSSILFGSNTSKVVKKVKLPVLVVPKEAPLLPPENLMLALDLELEERPARFDIFTSLVDHYKSKLIVLNVTPPDAKLPSVHDKVLEENILSVLKLGDASIEHVSSTSVKKAINEEVANRSIDLLCVINHHEGWLHHSLGKSVTTQMVLDSHTPLLVFRQF